jgi:hypothetical protein
MSQKFEHEATMSDMIANMIAVLGEVADYLDLYADVVDGDDGVPQANEAMRLLHRVDAIYMPAAKAYLKLQERPANEPEV